MAKKSSICVSCCVNNSLHNVLHCSTHHTMKPKCNMNVMKCPPMTGTDRGGHPARVLFFFNANRFLLFFLTKRYGKMLPRCWEIVSRIQIFFQEDPIKPHHSFVPHAPPLLKILDLGLYKVCTFNPKKSLHAAHHSTVASEHKHAYPDTVIYYSPTNSKGI